MSSAASFAFLDSAGHTLRFDQFEYERPAEVGDYYDANWLRCRITIDAKLVCSIHASMLTNELTDLAAKLRSVLDSACTNESLKFEPMEPHIELELSRNGRRVFVASRLDADLGLGPVIAFDFTCRADEVANTLADLEGVIKHFPERVVGLR